jgi:hypothetical protein
MIGQLAYVKCPVKKATMGLKIGQPVPGPIGRDKPYTHLPKHALVSRMV